jgi:hypothetical protein
MQYHVGRNGQQLGQFTEEEVRQGLESGRFLTSDLAWREGLPQWKPLGEVLAPPSQPASPSAGATGGFPPPNPAVPFAPPPPLGAHTGLPVRQSAPASGLAVTSLISGIVALMLCGLGGIGTLAAIITGHLSLSRIKRSGGMVGGRGMALAGVILGYVSILSTLAGFASFSLGYESYREGSQMATTIITQKAAAKEAHDACRVYAAANGGKYPATLEELVQKGMLKAETLENLQTLKAPTWVGEPGFQYHGEGVDGLTSGEVPILTSRAESPRGEKIVLYHDGRVEVIQPGY